MVPLDVVVAISLKGVTFLKNSRYRTGTREPQTITTYRNMGS